MRFSTSAAEPREFCAYVTTPSEIAPTAVATFVAAFTAAASAAAAVSPRARASSLAAVPAPLVRKNVIPNIKLLGKDWNTSPMTLTGSRYAARSGSVVMYSSRPYFSFRAGEMPLTISPPFCCCSLANVPITFCWRNCSNLAGSPFASCAAIWSSIAGCSTVSASFAAAPSAKRPPARAIVLRYSISW